MAESCINSPVPFSALKDGLLFSAGLVHQQMPPWPQNIKVPSQVPYFPGVTGARGTEQCTLQHHKAQLPTHTALYFLSSVPSHILQHIELVLPSVFTISPARTIPQQVLFITFPPAKVQSSAGKCHLPSEGKAGGNWPLQGHCYGLNIGVPPKYNC